MVSKDFLDLLSEYSILVAIIASLDDGKIEMIGEKEDLAYDGLVGRLFGDAETIATLNRSLEGQMLPQVWSQGAVTCIVCKLSNNRIVGLFYHETGDTFEQYRWSKELNSRLEELWGKSG